MYTEDDIRLIKNNLRQEDNTGKLLSKWFILSKNPIDDEISNLHLKYIYEVIKERHPDEVARYERDFQRREISLRDYIEHIRE